jgi:hypothetical protein
MNRFLMLSIAAGVAFSATSAFAAGERVRGVIAGVSGDTLTVRPASGPDVKVTLTAHTRYSKVASSSLSHVDPGAYIGTATKSVGQQLVALEVVVFPPALKGTGEGHYAWDRIPDTTMSHGASASSAMTSGTVSAEEPAAGDVKSTMTNGTVSSADASGSAKEITVTYKGGKQTIIVPPTAPIVTFRPGEKAELTSGATVFVNGVNQAGEVAANSVSVGIDGVKPPM